jgi:hypothetical protein
LGLTAATLIRSCLATSPPRHVAATLARSRDENTLYVSDRAPHRPRQRTPRGARIETATESTPTSTPAGRDQKTTTTTRTGVPTEKYQGATSRRLQRHGHYNMGAIQPEAPHLRLATSGQSKSCQPPATATTSTTTLKRVFPLKSTRRAASRRLQQRRLLQQGGLHNLKPLICDSPPVASQEAKDEPLGAQGNGEILRPSPRCCAATNRH